MVKLSKAEMETIILWNQEDDTVDISTFDTKHIRVLMQLAQKHPDLFIVEPLDKCGCLNCKMPKELLRISFFSPESKRKQIQLNSSGLVQFRGDKAGA